MASPRSERLTITPTSAKPLSIRPGSRVLRSPLNDEEIWKRLKDAGLDEESIKRKDKAALVAYIAKLEAQMYEHQHHMGLLILEKKELASKYEQVMVSAESSDLLRKHDSAVHLSALSEARRREENLKKAVGVKDECITSLEKALHEMRAECAETKVSAESKFAEGHSLIDEAKRKFMEAEAKMQAAESLQAEASRYNHTAERKLQEVEGREDDLRRRIISFKSDCDEKEKEMILERQSISERQKGLQQEQERLLEAQALLNQREDHILSRSQELIRLQKELDDAKVKIEKEHRALHDEKSKLELMEAILKRRDEALSKRGMELNKKEQELLDFQVKLASRKSGEIQKVIVDQEAVLRTKKCDFETELQMQRKLAENEIETKRRAWELREVDLKQREDQLLEREHELEVLSRALGEREKDLTEMSSVLEEKDRRFRTAEEEFQLYKTLVQKEKEQIDKVKHDLQNSLDSLENKRKEVDHAEERVEAMKSETDDFQVLIVKLKEEIDFVRSQKSELLAKADKLQAEKAKFEADWDLIDEKKEELCKEAQHIAEEKMIVSKFIKDERENLRKEKEAMRHQYSQDLESLAHEREEFMNKMVCEHTEWFGKMQQERADFLLDIEMQKKELDNLIEKRREEVERYLMEREKDFEQQKQIELQNISALKEKAAKELEQISLEMKKLHAEREEINLDRERRNREWAELNNCIEELKVQRDKLQQQRELLHADRVEIHAQTEELKKLEHLQVISDDNVITEMLKSDMESNQQKILARKNWKHQTVMQGDGLNSRKEVESKNFSNGFDTPYVQKPGVSSPPSPVRFSWIKRCTELIFRHSPEKLLIENVDRPLVSHSCNASNGQRHLGNDKPLSSFSKGQQMKYPLGEPKVIVEVTPAAKVVNRRSDFESEIKEDVNEKSVFSLADQNHLARRKRGNGDSISNVGAPLMDQRQNKKQRSEGDATEHVLEQGSTCCVISTQSDAPEVQQLLISSNQTQDNTKVTSMEMIDKVIHVSDMTSEKVDVLNIPNEVKKDHLQNPTSEADLARDYRQ
ncbi:hypothetical protein L6164_027955 [Bauhinia variegata]|uniref:Uncharacterized protein n=1 Tax=Bauhinia variegata TaxID=167791 RepID=A0ACB9LW54_BAUVA|nr:hypothetical protein L6164_027955 [Bauhinia variegata]